MMTAIMGVRGYKAFLRTALRGEDERFFILFGANALLTRLFRHAIMQSIAHFPQALLLISPSS